MEAMRRSGAGGLPQGESVGSGRLLQVRDDHDWAGLTLSASVRDGTIRIWRHSDTRRHCDD